MKNLANFENQLIEIEIANIMAAICTWIAEPNGKKLPIISKKRLSVNSIYSRDFNKASINGARRTNASISDVAAVILIQMASKSFMPIFLYNILFMYNELLSMRNFFCVF